MTCMIMEMQKRKLASHCIKGNCANCKKEVWESMLTLDDAYNVWLGKCPWCGKEVCEEDFKDKPPIFLKEFKISGICYDCQDGFFESG